MAVTVIMGRVEMVPVVLNLFAYTLIIIRCAFALGGGVQLMVADSGCGK